MRALILLLLALLTGCVLAGQADEARLRTALEVTADVIDPAYEASVSACIALERAELSAVKAGTVKLEQAKAELERIRKSCDHTREAFDAIRVAHDKAAKLVEAGKLEEAQKQLEHVRELWRYLGGKR